MSKSPEEQPFIGGLPYRKPKLGRDYWIVENALPDPMAVRERNLERQDWRPGYPYRPETWPGLRASNALTPEEIRQVEASVRQCTGASQLGVADSPETGRLDHNTIQLVGERESGPRPHTDSRRLCRYAAVLYLTPDAPPEAGTSFYRLRRLDGSLDGNHVPAPHANLVDALGVRRLPLDAWQEDVKVDNVFNRLLVYYGNMVHSATRYFGLAAHARRMTAVFFWMSLL